MATRALQGKLFEDVSESRGHVARWAVRPFVIMESKQRPGAKLLRCNYLNRSSRIGPRSHGSTVYEESKALLLICIFYSLVRQDSAKYGNLRKRDATRHRPRTRGVAACPRRWEHKPAQAPGRSVRHHYLSHNRLASRGQHQHLFSKRPAALTLLPTTSGMLRNRLE
jgi:hypothetical protein